MKKAVTDKQRNNSEGAARRLANLKPFRPGQSGNPRGRPKSITLSEAYRHELGKLDENDPQRRTFAEILAERMIVKASGGIARTCRSHGGESSSAGRAVHRRELALPEAIRQSAIEAESDPNQIERLLHARQIALMRQTAEESNRHSSRGRRRTNRLGGYKQLVRQRW
jgi:Family of unknown function (DUF5681)